MPELDSTNNTKQEPNTLADVPEGEWWIDMEGDLVQHAEGKVVWYDSISRAFKLSHMKPEHTKVIRKLCGPVELTLKWPMSQTDSTETVE